MDGSDLKRNIRKQRSIVASSRHHQHRRAHHLVQVLTLGSAAWHIFFFLFVSSPLQCRRPALFLPLRTRSSASASTVPHRHRLGLRVQNSKTFVRWSLPVCRRRRRRRADRRGLRCFAIFFFSQFNYVLLYSCGPAHALPIVCVHGWNEDDDDY